MTDQNSKMEVARKKAAEATRNIQNVGVKEEQIQKPNQEPSQKPTDLGYENRLKIARTMENTAERNAENASPQISKDNTPSKNASPNQNEPSTTYLQDRHDNFPQQEQQTAPKSNLQDVKNIGENMQKNGVEYNNPPQNQQTKSDIEKTFDKNSQASKPNQEQALSETDKITQQAKQQQSAQQEAQSQSNSQQWGK